MSSAPVPELKVPLLLPVSGTVMPSAPGLLLQVLHVGPAGRGAGVVLVLDLVGDDRAGAVGQLVPGQDPVDLGQPLVGVGLELGVVGAVLFVPWWSASPAAPHRPPRALMYGAGRAITYSPRLLGHVEQQVDVGAPPLKS